MIPSGIRINKHLAALGICSRREADAYISAGKILVDGVVVNNLGTRIQPGQRVELSQAVLDERSSFRTVLFHKPVGVVSSQPEKGERPARSFIELEANLVVCGRLDKDSHGLLVLSENSAIVRQLIGPESTIEKEYVVEFNGYLSEKGLTGLREGGLLLDGKITKPCSISVLSHNRLKFILKEGRNRQIRRMLGSVGCSVKSLCRTRIGRIELGDLAPGSWAFLPKGVEFDG
uniref:RNA-binding S4 domain-containing protein n=1 Tax=Spongospora subterranea TaxID=70186 RepID=A0A0H5RBU8_9EUKA|eukprot:CRZ11077.1 hypothetical protein [Spongospora subterranea]